MRIIAFASAAVLAATVFVTPALAAAPKLSGAYTFVGTQLCQAPVGKQGGDIEQQIGTATFTATATGATMKLVVKDQWGPSVASAASIKATTVTVNGSVVISGSANPYPLTLKMTVGTQTMTTTGFVQLDLTGATDGIARRAVILSTSSNGEMTGNNCTMQAQLLRQ